MPCSSRKVSLVWGAVLGALILLRSGIVWMGDRSPDFRYYTDIIEREGIQPAAIFYTESPLALAAEKKIRQDIRHARAVTNGS